MGIKKCRRTEELVRMNSRAVIVDSFKNRLLDANFRELLKKGIIREYSEIEYLTLCME